MSILKRIKSFANDQSGAVTVDWVVLTAAIVGLGLAVIVAVANSVNQVSGAVQVDLQAADTFSTRVTDAFTN